jgi:hypothetical protein
MPDRKSAMIFRGKEGLFTSLPLFFFYKAILKIKAALNTFILKRSPVPKFLR